MTIDEQVEDILGIIDKASITVKLAIIEASIRPDPAYCAEAVRRVLDHLKRQPRDPTCDWLYSSQ